MLKSRRKYDPSYKLRAIELSYSRGHITEVAEDLGIASALLYRWRREHGRSIEEFELLYINQQQAV